MIGPGTLRLHMVADTSGRTRTASVQQRYPQRITTALHCDEAFPGAAVVCVQSPSGGTFSDDGLTTDIHVEQNAHLRITTQAATQVFHGTGPGARHRITFRVDDHATLEYLPRTLIPHADSRYTQRMDVDVAASGCFIGWEGVAAGRLGHGERYRYRSYDSAVRVAVAGRTVARDLILLEPPSAARLIDADYLATLLMVTPRAAALLTDVREVLSGSVVHAGATELPSAAGILVRITTDEAPELHRLQQRLLDVVRRLLPRTRYERSPSL